MIIIINNFNFNKLEEKFDNNEDITDYMDFTNVKKLSSVIDEEIEHINIHLLLQILLMVGQKKTSLMFCMVTEKRDTPGESLKR